MYQELKETFIAKFDYLNYINEDVAKEFQGMVDELQQNSEKSFLRIYNLSNLQECINDISEAIDMEITGSMMPDFPEEGRLYINQLVTIG